MARRYPQHHLSSGRVRHPRSAGGLPAYRSGRALAVDAARENGAQLVKKCAGARDPRGAGRGADLDRHRPVDVRPGDRGGGLRVGRRCCRRSCSGTCTPKRNFLTWFTARDAQQFVPEAFPVFIRITGDRSLYGAPTVDGVTVKATLDGRGTPAADADTMARELTPAEVRESIETVQAFLPGLIPEIVRSDAYPDLFTSDSTGLLGPLPGSDRIYCATGFSGTGFKICVGARRDRRRRGVGPGSARGRPGLPSSRALRLARLSSRRGPPAHRRAGPAAGHSRPFRISMTRRALLSMWWRTCRTAVAGSPDSMACRITWCSARMSSGCSNSRSSNDSTVR